MPPGRPLATSPSRPPSGRWHAVQGTFGAWVVSSSATLEKKFDLQQPSGATPLTMQTQSVSEVDLISGETTRSCIVVNGQTPVPGSTTAPLPATARDVIKR